MRVEHLLSRLPGGAADIRTRPFAGKENRVLLVADTAVEKLRFVASRVACGVAVLVVGTGIRRPSLGHGS